MRAILSRWSFAYLILPAALAFALPPAPAFAKNLPPQEAYNLLGIATDASAADIEKTYSGLKDHEMTPIERAKLEVAHVILTTPELRTQYDAGKAGQMEVEVPPEYRDEVAEMLKGSPEAQSRLAKTGHVTADFLGNMMTFYLTMGGIQAFKCLGTGDPTFCTHYVNDLKKPSGHIGFGLFVGTSKLASMGIEKALGKNAVSKSAAGFGGLAAGTLVNEAFMELLNHPQTKAYFDARKIADPAEREKKEHEALSKLMADTFGNKDWYYNKIPNLTAMIAASYLSDKTWHFALTRAQKSVVTRQAGLMAAGKDPGDLGCFFSKLQTYVLAADDLKGLPKFAQKRAMEAAGLLVFTAWQDVLTPPIKAAWDYQTIDRKLNANRSPEQVSIDTILAKPVSEGKEPFQKSMDAADKLWEAKRRTMTADAEQLLSVHTEEMLQFNTATGAHDLVYGWMVDGMKLDDFRWDSIRSQLFKADTKPGDPEVQAVMSKYLQAFFCGPSPKDSFRDSRNIHGLPVPFYGDVDSQPYRVVDTVDPQLCAHFDKAAFVAKLHERDYKKDFRKASIDFKLAIRSARNAKLRSYEDRVQDQLIKALQGDGSKSVSGLPKGVLPCFDEELADLKKLRARAEGTDYAKLVDDQIDHVQQKRDSAQKLLTYMQTPFEKRKAPGINLADLLAGGDAGGEDEDWSKVVKYYNGFVIQ